MLHFATKLLVGVVSYVFVIIVGFWMGRRNCAAAGTLFPTTAALGIIAVAGSMWLDGSDVVRSKDLWNLAFWFLWGAAQEQGAKWHHRELERRARPR